MVAGIGWWYFRESPLPEYGPAYREYAYVTNGKSNTVTIINVLAFRAEKTLTVGSNPTGIAANGKKNEVYVVNTGSSNVSVIDAEKNQVMATKAASMTARTGGRYSHSKREASLCCS